MPTTTYKIPASRLTELEKKIAQINKRAEKLETPPVSMTIGAREQITVTQGGRIALRMGTKYTYEAVNVTVTGDTPVLNGWQFIATVLHKPAGNEFVHHTGNETELSEYVFADRDCDHCHKRRIRNATYIVKNIETSELRQVGSDCLGDFTGYHSPQAAAKALENIYKLFMDLRQWGGSTAGRTTKKFFLEEWMAYVAYSVRVHGFLSKSKAEHEGGIPTTERAKRHIIAAENGEDVPAAEDRDYAKAQEVITYIRTNLTDPSNDFEQQLVAIYASDDQDVSEWEMPRAAAGFATMWRMENERQKAVNEVNSDHYGDKKTTYNLVLTCTRIGRGYVNDYDTFTRPMNFTDAQGHDFLWYCTSKAEVEVGKRYNMRGTVKDHKIDRYNGNKVTVLTRCKVQSEAAAVVA